MKSKPKLYLLLFATGTFISDLEVKGENWLFDGLRKLTGLKAVLRNVILGSVVLTYLSIREWFIKDKPLSSITGTNTYPTIFTFGFSFPYD